MGGIMKYLKRLKISDMIIAFVFVILNVLSVIIWGLWGLIAIPISLLLVIIYYNTDKILKYIKIFIKNVKKKKKKKEITTEIENEEDIKEKNDIILEDKEVDVVKVVEKNKKKKVKVKKEKKKKRKFWKKLVTLILILGILGVIAVAGFMLYIAVSAGNFDPDRLTYQDQTVIYDKNGEMITTLGVERRESVEYDELPQVLIDAIVATEDSRFFQHNGVDLARFLKASFKQLLGQRDAGGASTLTMQISKNNLTSTEKEGIEGIIRKFQDVYIAVFQIEKQYSKEEIIEYYVNDNLLGSNVYGVGEAAEYYFGKSVSELSLPEAALLAGLFQAPNKYNPYKDPDAASERRSLVLDLMVRHGYISVEEADMAKNVNISSMLVGIPEETGYQGYIDTVLDEVIELTGSDPTLVPMKVYTNLDRSIQDGINAVLSGEAYSGWVDDYIQAGIAVTDVNTGAIVAVGAGRNRSGERVFNYATQSKRQPGSTSKPLFDYGPGFEFNNFSTYTLFNDEPWAYTNGPSIGNWDGAFEGLITLRRALSVSRNIPALKAFQQVNKKNIYNFIRGVGLDPELEDGVLHEAYAIGGGDGFTPLEMAVAYACFANGGYYIAPHTVNKIEYRNTGEVKEFSYDKERVMKDSTAYLVNNVLKYAVDYAFNGGARKPGTAVAAKTGTSNFDSATLQRYGLPSWAVHDLWTVAYTPEYSVALWYGYEENSSEYYLSGASAPKDAVMAAIMPYIPATTKQFEMPSSVVASQVEFGTWPAQLPSEYTPSDLIMTEYFISGTEPTEVSERFAKLSNITNSKTTDTSSGTKITWNFTTPKVLTESYLKTYFSQSVFGNGTDAFVADRLAYNANNLGDLGFGIYKKLADGTLTRIGFTKNNEYLYTSNVSGNVTLVIKTEYEKFSANASDGVEVKFIAKAISNNDDNDDDDDNDENNNELKATLTHETITIDTSLNEEYHEEGVVVKYNNSDVSNKATYSYSVETITTTSIKTLEKKINSLDKGTYQIKYDITYNNKKVTVYRKVIIK